MPAFHADAKPDISWECFGFDEPWNGWCTPVVDMATVFEVLHDAAWMVRTDGVVILAASDPDVPEDEIMILKPDVQGRYHLRDLSWTFVEMLTIEAKVLSYDRSATRA